MLYLWIGNHTSSIRNADELPHCRSVSTAQLAQKTSRGYSMHLDTTRREFTGLFHDLPISPISAT